MKIQIIGEYNGYLVKIWIMFQFFEVSKLARLLGQFPVFPSPFVELNTI